MNNFITISLLLFFPLVTSCSKDSDPVKPSTSKKEIISKEEQKKKDEEFLKKLRIESRMKNPLPEQRDNVSAKVRKKYPFPSIMVKDDIGTKYIKIDNKWWEPRPGITGVVGNDGWIGVSDKYSRPCQSHSPEITYEHLQNLLHFLDSDVIKVEKKEGEPEMIVKNKWEQDTYSKSIKTPTEWKPDAYIKTDWLTLYIMYTDKPYDGKDKSVKLKAILVDNEQQGYADKHAEHDKTKGPLDSIIDFVTPRH